MAGHEIVCDIMAFVFDFYLVGEEQGVKYMVIDQK